MRRIREVVLRRPPQATPVAADFDLVERDAPEAAAGLVVVRNLYLSLDPYLGSRLRGRHMGEPAPGPGESLPGWSVGEVVASGDPAFVAGDRVVGEIGWAEVGRAPGSRLRKVDGHEPASAHLGVFGMPGLTAWAGVTQLARVRPGDVFSVDAAAGAVGGLAGQIARILGARVVGLAGGAVKCALVRETYGFEAAIDYRLPGWVEAYAAAAAPGPSVHFENVGLSVLKPVLGALQPYGRVVLCGMVEHDRRGTPPELPIGPLMGRRAAVMGLVVYDFAGRWKEWTDLARPWVREGLLSLKEDVADGPDGAPAQFERLMAGENVGKTLVRMGFA